MLGVASKTTPSTSESVRLFSLDDLARFSCRDIAFLDASGNAVSFAWVAPHLFDAKGQWRKPGREVLFYRPSERIAESRKRYTDAIIAERRLIIRLASPDELKSLIPPEVLEVHMAGPFTARGL